MIAAQQKMTAGVSSHRNYFEVETIPHNKSCAQATARSDRILHAMTLTSVCAVWLTRVKTVDPEPIAIICRFLLPTTASAISNAIINGHLDLARFLLSSLAQDICNVHALDKRLRARRVLAVAAFVGNKDMMDHILSTFACGIDELVVREAVRGGNAGVISWLSTKGVSNEHQKTSLFGYDLLLLAAKHGELGTLQALVNVWENPDNESIDWKEAGLHEAAHQAFRLAARYGNVQIVKYLRNLGCDSPRAKEMNDELHTGPFDALIYEQKQPCVSCQNSNGDSGGSCTGWRMDNAAFLGNLDNVKWFHANRPKHPCSTAAMDGAATNGHLLVVQWLHENRSEGCTSSALDGAAANNRVDVVEYLLSNRAERFTAQAVQGAAANGHLTMVKKLLKGAFGAIGDVGNATSDNNVHAGVALVAAASNNHTHVVQWLLENYSQQCLTKTMTTGLDVVSRFIRPRESTHLVMAIEGAAKNGYLDTIKLLLLYYHSYFEVQGLHQGIPTLHFAILAAAIQGRLVAVKLLVTEAANLCCRGYSITDLYRALAVGHIAAARNCRLSVLKWIARQIDVKPVSSSELAIGLRYATDRADFEALQWIAEQWAISGKSNLDKAIDLHAAGHRAASLGYLEVVQWMSLTFANDISRESTAEFEGDCLPKDRVATYDEAIRSFEWSRCKWSVASFEGQRVTVF